MSLLYKALNQAAQLREKGALKADPASRPGAAATAPLVDRLMDQAVKSGASRDKSRRITRLMLFGLAGLGIAAIALALLVPASPPEQTATPEPVTDPLSPPVAEVAPAPEPVPAPQNEVAPEPPAGGTAETTTAAPEEKPVPVEAQSGQAPSAPQARISAGSEPEEFAPAQKRIRDGGLENYVEQQLARESTSGMAPPVNIGRRSPVQITDETAIVSERYESAALMLERGRPEESLQIYDQLLRNNPKDRLALLGRAAALQKLGRSLLAVSAYEDVLAAYPGDEWAMVNLLGLVSAQEPQRALAQLERLQRLNPGAALLPAQIGMMQMAQGNYEMATRSLEKAVSLEPENAKYVFNLAVAYDRWGQPQIALRYYRQCLEMAVANPDGQVPLEAVRQRMAFLDVN